MSSHHTLTNKVSALLKAILDTFHGQDPSSAWRVKIDGKNVLIFGEADELIPSDAGDGTLKLTKKLIGVSRDYQKSDVGEVRITAKCESSKKLYGVTGRLKYCNPKATPPALSDVVVPLTPAVVSMHPNELTQHTDSIEQCKSELDLKSSKEQKKIARREREDKNFNLLLKTVEAQLDAGQDPLVTLSYFSRVSNRSRATLYREQGTVLPKFTKIGKNSYLLHSDLVRYKLGMHFVNAHQANNMSEPTTVATGQKTTQE